MDPYLPDTLCRRQSDSGTSYTTLPWTSAASVYGYYHYPSKTTSAWPNPVVKVVQFTDAGNEIVKIDCRGDQ